MTGLIVSARVTFIAPDGRWWVIQAVDERSHARASQRLGRNPASTRERSCVARRYAHARHRHCSTSSVPVASGAPCSEVRLRSLVEIRVSSGAAANRPHRGRAGLGAALLAGCGGGAPGAACPCDRGGCRPVSAGDFSRPTATTATTKSAGWPNPEARCARSPARPGLATDRPG